MTPAEARKELERRRLARRKPWSPEEILLPYQHVVFSDQTPDRALVGTRQIGKSTLAAVEVIDAGIKNPGSDCVYVDMDIEHADKVLWREIERLLREYQVDAEIIDGELHLANGAVGYVFSGAPSQIKKLQGLKYAILIIDEAQEATALNGILTLARPALMRHNGRVLLLGIPGYMKNIGPWWEITEGAASPMWSQHRGHYSQNTYLDPVAQKRQYELAKAELGEDNPDFVRHWKGEWPATDSSLRVFRYFPEVNGYDGNAPATDHRSLGIDPGGVLDAEAVIITGVVVTADERFRQGDILHLDEDFSEKLEGGDWDATADRVGPLDKKWKPGTRYYDYGSVKKGALKLIYQKDYLVEVDAVPEKDPEMEVKRINRLLQTKRLWILRGSKLEKDLLYTMKDAKALAQGDFKISKTIYKQNGADALRAALWGQYAYVEATKEKPTQTDAEAEAENVKRVWRQPDKSGPVNRYAAALGESTETSTNRPARRRNGPIQRY